MSYVDEVWKRANELAGKEWDDWGPVAVKWSVNAINYEGSDRAYQLAKDLYFTAVTGNSVAAEIDQMRDQFIEEVSDSFYAQAEQEIREEQQDAADALKEEYYDSLREEDRIREAKEASLRG